MCSIFRIMSLLLLLSGSFYQRGTEAFTSLFPKPPDSIDRSSDLTSQIMGVAASIGWFVFAAGWLQWIQTTPLKLWSHTITQTGEPMEAAAGRRVLSPRGSNYCFSQRRLSRSLLSPPAVSPDWERADCRLLQEVHWLWISTSYSPTPKIPNYPFNEEELNSWGRLKVRSESFSQTLHPHWDEFKLWLTLHEASVTSLHQQPTFIHILSHLYDAVKHYKSVKCRLSSSFKL